MLDRVAEGLSGNANLSMRMRGFRPFVPELALIYSRSKLFEPKPCRDCSGWAVFLWKQFKKILETFDMYSQLASLRLRWYASATANVLFRHWQAIVIAVLVVPAGMPIRLIVESLAYPVTGIVGPGHDVMWYTLHVICVQLLAVIWVMVQRGGLGGGPFMNYAASLPISPGLARRVSVTTLLFSDSILFIPVLAAAVVAVPAKEDGSVGTVFGMISVAALAILAVSAQLAVLERNFRIPLAALFADVLLGWSLGRQPDPESWVLLALTLGCALALIVREPVSGRSLTTRSRPVRRQSRFIDRHRAWRLPAPLQIQGKALFVHQPPATILRMCSAVAVSLGGDFLIRVFRFDGRALPVAIIAMAASALIVSGFYRTLDVLRAPMVRYVAALPLPKRFWMVRDVAFVMLLDAVPLGILLIPLLAYGRSFAITLAVLAFADLGLVALLRLPVLLGGRQATLLGLILAACWSGVAMAAVH
ncbi:MAG: hypothetical protein ACYDHM_12625 [Acidiferrobacterales bacterium]